MTLATRRLGTAFSCPGTGIVGWLYSSSISSPAAHDAHLLRNSMEPVQGIGKHTLTAQGYSREQAHSPCPVGHRTALRSAAGRHSREPCAKLINSAQPQPIFKTHTDLQPTFERGRGQRPLHHIGAREAVAAVRAARAVVRRRGRIHRQAPAHRHPHIAAAARNAAVMRRPCIVGAVLLECLSAQGYAALKYTI